jgi:hypothetical protein
MTWYHRSAKRIEFVENKLISAIGLVANAAVRTNKVQSVICRVTSKTERYTTFKAHDIEIKITGYFQSLIPDFTKGHGYRPIFSGTIDGFEFTHSMEDIASITEKIMPERFDWYDLKVIKKSWIKRKQKAK